jgi:hypothetical protein
VSEIPWIRLCQEKTYYDSSAAAYTHLLTRTTMVNFCGTLLDLGKKEESMCNSGNLFFFLQCLMLLACSYGEESLLS